MTEFLPSKSLPLTPFLYFHGGSHGHTPTLLQGSPNYSTAFSLSLSTMLKKISPRKHFSLSPLLQNKLGPHPSCPPLFFQALHHVTILY